MAGSTRKSLIAAGCSANVVRKVARLADPPRYSARGNSLSMTRPVQSGKVTGIVLPATELRETNCTLEGKASADENARAPQVENQLILRARSRSRVELDSGVNL